jgi:hypothetical protein
MELISPSGHLYFGNAQYVLPGVANSARAGKIYPYG